MGKLFKEKTLAFQVPKQQAFFNKVFPKGVTAENVETAHDLCQRTIDKNEGQHG